MYKLICICLAIVFTEVRGGYDFHGLDGLHGLHGGSFLESAYLKEPVYPAPVLPAPTIIKAIAPAPPPIYHAAPIIKAIAPPATSYATVTQVHVTHPVPVVKVAPAPIFKTLALPAHLPIAAHAYPHFPH